MNQPRKSLNDALANEFVYEKSDFPSPRPRVSELPPSAKPKPSIIEKFHPVEAKEVTKRLTVDLPDSMHRKLSILAAKTGRTKAYIVRTLLDDALSEIEE